MSNIKNVPMVMKCMKCLAYVRTATWQPKCFRSVGYKVPEARRCSASILKLGQFVNKKIKPCMSWSEHKQTFHKKTLFQCLRIQHMTLKLDNYFSLNQTIFFAPAIEYMEKKPDKTNLVIPNIFCQSLGPSFFWGSTVTRSKINKNHLL